VKLAATPVAGRRRARRRTWRAAAALAAAGAAVAWFATAPPLVPSFDAVRARHRPSDVPLLDRHGAVLHELRTDAGERRLAWVPLAEMSPALAPAVLAVEDRRFRDHRGVDLRALAGAILEGLGGRTARGASTITMQLAALLDPELAPRRSGRTLAQKLRQMRAALALERHWSKDRILEAYLNRAVFRGELRGIGAAAALLFGKAPHGLDSAESLVLAAGLRSPSAAAAVIARRAAHLAAASGAGVEAAALAAAAERAAVAARRPTPTDLAPHLARRLLAGRAAPLATTLDAATQRQARAALGRALTALRGRNVEDGAVLVADNATGDVLAWVGGSGALSRARFVDAVRARRQPGSTLKPFLYGLAFERRLLTPATLIEDAPLAVTTSGGLYRPRDYDDRFRGLVSARTALAASLNVPAVRTLGLLGGDAFVALLHDLGFAAVTEDGEFYGPALALGSADATLFELVGAYRALANGGIWSPLRVVADAASADAETHGAAARAAAASSAPSRRVLSAAAAFQVGDILADRESRSPTFGLESALATRFFTAVKTGTSQDMRDNWCLGWSELYTVGVWVGNASGAPMHDVSGTAGAAPVWLEVMTWLHRATPSAAPAPPPGLVAATVAFPDDVEPQRREWLVAGTAPGTGVLAAGAPRIATPIDGTIVALDPDIPAERQRLPLRAAGAAAGLRWRVDDTDLGAATAPAPALWQPTPGMHVVALVDAARVPLATATVEVRGGRR
jgi:penicillin-binding protein 1C